MDRISNEKVLDRLMSEEEFAKKGPQIFGNNFKHTRGFLEGRLEKKSQELILLFVKIYF